MCLTTIVERVLPKYMKPDALVIPQHEHAVDIQKILRAMGADSEAGKRKVVRAARQTPFLKSVDSSATVSFKKPLEVYMDNPDLRFYFLDCTNVWFLNEQPSASSTESDVWRELGVARLPRRIQFSDGLPPVKGSTQHGVRPLKITIFTACRVSSNLCRMPGILRIKRDPLSFCGDISKSTWS